MDRGAYERLVQSAHALVDRAAFVVESTSVALLVTLLIGFAAARCDIAGFAYLSGRFWVRLAEVSPDERAVALSVLSVGLACVAVIVAWARWPAANRCFHPFPPSRRLRQRMRERLA